MAIYLRIWITGYLTNKALWQTAYGQRELSSQKISLETGDMKKFFEELQSLTRQDLNLRYAAGFATRSPATKLRPSCQATVEMSLAT